MRVFDYLKIVSFTILLKFSMFFKATLIWGSICASFSLTSFLHPALGAFAGPGALAAIFGGIFLAKFYLLEAFPLYHLAYHIPGFCAALVCARPSWRLSLIIPIVSMIGFMLHPVGSQAWIYTLYWIIPIALYFFPKQYSFLQALQATFVAHALGSLIWIYTVPMSAAQWMALIPVVAVERFAFALGATGVYYIGAFLEERIKNYAKQQTSCISE